jgi:predicted membrane protein (TIGR00267 family)
LSLLSDENKEKLLQAAKKIHAHKLVQIKGYRGLISSAKDERIVYLLNRVNKEEENIAKFWFDKIRELGGSAETNSYLFDLKAKILISVLGTKGYFEWALIGEAEGIQDLAVQAGKIDDIAMSETWSRFASEERMHLDRIRTQVLGMDSWEIRGGSGVRDMTNIFTGLYGGLLSTLAFVTGVVGALVEGQLVILSGLAALVAGSISSGAGAYQSSISEIEVLVRESQLDRAHEVNGRRPQDERDKLIEFYHSQGYSIREAEALVKRLEEKEHPFKVGALEELGLASKEIGNPMKAGILSGVSFGLASTLPLSPFAFKFLRSTDALIISIIVTLASLFCIGAMKTIFSRKKWIRSGLDVVLFGAATSTVTYLIGKLVSLII